MTDLLGIPAWLEVGAGLIGVGFALGGIARARRLGWRSRSDQINAWGLLVFGLLLAGVGIVRWTGV